MHLLADADVGALLRITAEAKEIGADVRARRRFILGRLVSLVGGCGAACSQVDPRPGGDSGWCLPRSITLTGALATMASLTARYLTGRLGALDPCVPLLMRAAAPAVTFRRDDVMDRSWFESAHFRDLRRPNGLGESIYATVRVPGGGRLKISVFRELDDPPFTNREVRIVQMFNEHVPDAYFAGPAAAVAAPAACEGRGASLPPRLRPVLGRLLEGETEKEVARRLGLSRHTVHQYTHALFRVFGVNSRGELIARFVGGE